MIINLVMIIKKRKGGGGVMLLDNFALEPSGNLKSVFLKIDFADFIDFERSHFVSKSKNSYNFEGILMDNVTIFFFLLIVTHFASTGHIFISIQVSLITAGIPAHV